MFPLLTNKKIWTWNQRKSSPQKNSSRTSVERHGDFGKFLPISNLLFPQNFPKFSWGICQRISWAPSSCTNASSSKTQLQNVFNGAGIFAKCMNAWHILQQFLDTWFFDKLRMCHQTNVWKYRTSFSDYDPELGISIRHICATKNGTTLCDADKFMSTNDLQFPEIPHNPREESAGKFRAIRRHLLMPVLRKCNYKLDFFPNQYSPKCINAWRVSPKFTCTQFVESQRKCRRSDT